MGASGFIESLGIVDMYELGFRLICTHQNKTITIVNIKSRFHICYNTEKQRLMKKNYFFLKWFKYYKEV